MLRKINISYEQMRSVVVQALRKGGADQLTELYRSVAEAACQLGIATKEGEVRMLGRDSALCPEDAACAQNIMWDLIIEGVVRPGLNDGMNNNLPFYHITEWGKKVISGGGPTPYDPDGYVARLKRDIPTLDEVILTYLNESLHTFRIGCLLSSTISLGCACEKALLLLIEAYGDYLPESSRRKFHESTQRRMIKHQFEAFRKSVDGLLRAKLPGDLEDGLDVELNAIFDIIRNQRNDAGHPTGKEIERERAYANLVVVPVYFKKVYALIAWLEAATAAATAGS